MDRASISEQIDRILRSPSFASKSQLRKLLEVLSQNMDTQTTLKPDRVIKELWPEETKTKGSADVATEMNRLRHALDSYYSGEGKADPITISLPNRSAPSPDGTPEKRWIVAKPREEDPAGSRPANQDRVNQDRVNQDHRPVPRVSARKGLRIAAAMVAVCLGVFISVRMLTAHGQPKFGRLDGATLRIMDGEGKELWSKAFPRDSGPTGTTRRAPVLWFGDLEGKGRTSVLFVYSPAGPYGILRR